MNVYRFPIKLESLLGGLPAKADIIEDLYDYRKMSQTLTRYASYLIGATVSTNDTKGFDLVKEGQYIEAKKLSLKYGLDIALSRDVGNGRKVTPENVQFSLDKNSFYIFYNISNHDEKNLYCNIFEIPKDILVEFGINPNKHKMTYNQFKVQVLRYCGDKAIYTFNENPFTADLNKVVINTNPSESDYSNIFCGR